MGKEKGAPGKPMKEGGRRGRGERKKAVDDEWGPSLVSFHPTAE